MLAPCEYLCPYAIDSPPSPVKCELTSEVCDKPWSDCEVYQEYIKKAEEE